MLRFNFTSKRRVYFYFSYKPGDGDYLFSLNKGKRLWPLAFGLWQPDTTVPVQLKVRMESARGGGGDLAMASLSPPSTLSPPVVPMDLYVSNRKKLLDSLRDHLSASSRPSHGFVLLQVIDQLQNYWDELRDAHRNYPIKLMRLKFRICFFFFLFNVRIDEVAFVSLFL